MSAEQLCSDCGRREAAGSYCTGCGRPMGPADWRETVRSEAQIAASGVNARRRAERAAASTKTAKSGALR